MTASRPPGGSVFLVEDEVMIRMMVADMLDELGYSVAAEAGEINEAVKLQRRHRDEPRRKGREIGALRRRIDAREPLEPDPEIRIAAAVAALVDFQESQIAFALPRHLDAQHIVRGNGREIDVDYRV